MRRPASVALLILIGLAASPTRAAEFGILDIYDRFVLSAEAAKRCVPPNADADKAFALNFLDITNRAANRLQEQYPALRRDETADLVGERQKTLAEQVAKLAEKEGCSGETMRQLASLYDFHAHWDPYAQLGRKH